MSFDQKSLADKIEERLRDGFNPIAIEVKDESHLHAGHAGARESGESHFRILVVSSVFEGLSRVARHRRVNALLADELREQIHALAMKTLTPEEYDTVS